MKLAYPIYDIRFYEPCFHYKAYTINEIIKIVPQYLLESALPLEIIAIIWTIKCLQEETEFKIYKNELYTHKNIKTKVIYNLRNKKIYKQNIVGQLIYKITNLLSINTSTMINKEYKTIKLLNNIFFQYYEWLKNLDIIHSKNSLETIKITMENKIYEFYRKISLNDSKIKSKFYYQKSLIMLSNMIYFIENFRCITSGYPCVNCAKFNNHLVDYIDSHNKHKQFYSKSVICEECLYNYD